MDKPLIMVVEDEKEYSQRIAHAVESSERYQAVVANSAQEAFDLLKKNKTLFGILPNHIRCILLDIKMPEMDGLEFLKQLRKEYKDAIAVIMLTAYEDYEKWDRALGGYIAGYIRKPFDRKDLLKRLDTIFSEDEEATDKMISETFLDGIKRMEELKQGTAEH
jgi:CheY-like chemotaxis protein